MAQIVVSRKFRLDNLNIAQDLKLFQDLVNNQIHQGIQMPYSTFDEDKLVAVKRYYKQIQNPVNGLRERIHRCAAQHSYFALSEYRRNQENLKTIVSILLKDGYFSDNHKQIITKTSLTAYEVDNKLNFIRNLMLDELNTIDLHSFYADTAEQQKYNLNTQKLLNSEDFMDKILKSFNFRATRRLNARFKELHQANYSPTSNYDTTLLGMLNLNNIADVAQVSNYDWQLYKKQYRKYLKDTLDKINLQVNNWGSITDEKLLIKKLVKPFETQIHINGATIRDLLEFINEKFNEILIEQMLEYFRVNYMEINKFLTKLQLDLKQQVPIYLKIPKFKSTSIPFGIDDGQAFSFNEIVDTNNALQNVEINISTQPGQKITSVIRNVDRYEAMLKRGFKAMRGTLIFAHGKYYISIPFAKKASKKRENTRIAAADLGLKTFATLSVFDKKTEMDRKFLDQKQLGGKKNNWFVSPDKLNLKGKLLERRFEVRKQQSIRMCAKNGCVRHWHARVVEKCGWKKIGNIHKELIHQIATRIITYLNFHEVSRLVLENLKWSRHVSRSQSGYFLSHWQIHWFFSQIQQQLENMARLDGIVVEYVNPRYSSKKCWRCGEFGTRNGKQFACGSTTCKKYQIDADLNAARNLVKRSKKYP